jgi:hypothetical protein
MASGGSKSVAFILLIVNVILYFIVTAVAAWAVNHGIQRARETGSLHSLIDIIKLCKSCHGYNLL